MALENATCHCCKNCTNGPRGLLVTLPQGRCHPHHLFQNVHSLTYGTF
jgi:hypothetical protein